MIEVDDVKNKLREMRETMGDNVNPMAIIEDSPFCLYTNEDGTKHCIAGQLMIEFGLPAPNFTSVEVFNGLNGIGDEFSSDAMLFVRDMQIIADGGGNPDYGVDQMSDFTGGLEDLHPRPWGEVIDIMLGENNG